MDKRTFDSDESYIGSTNFQRLFFSEILSYQTHVRASSMNSTSKIIWAFNFIETYHFSTIQAYFELFLL